MKLSLVIILLGLFFLTNGTFIFTDWYFTPKSTFECMRPSVNNRLIIPFRYCLYDIDNNDLWNLKNATDAGLTLELVIGPTRCREPDE